MLDAKQATPDDHDKTSSDTDAPEVYGNSVDRIEKDDHSRYETSTRVVSLESLVSKDGSSRLSCRTLSKHISPLLATEDISRNYNYEAISYVWGDSTQREKIVCDGREIEVPRNLYHILSKLWRDDPHLLIWADALSIHQEDRLDKEYQVSKMASIFGQANKVHVWLGESNWKIEGFWPWLQLFENHDWLQPFLRSAKEYTDMREATDPSIGDNCGWDLSDDACMLGFQDLLARKWFTRAWTYQEVIAARSWTCHCGDLQVEGRAVEQLLDACENTLDNQVPKYAESGNGTRVFGLEICNIWSIAQQSNHGQFLRRSSERSLLYDLDNIRQRDASDQCDKVNAVIGLHPGLQLKPLYEETPDRIFTLAAKACIEQSQSLTLWGYRSPTLGHDRLNGLPSWATDWRKPSGLGGRKSYRLFKPHLCDCNRDGKISFSDDDENILIVHGAICVMITEDPAEGFYPKHWLEEISGLDFADYNMSKHGEDEFQGSQQDRGPDSNFKQNENLQMDRRKRHYPSLLYPFSDNDKTPKMFRDRFTMAEDGDYLCFVHGAPNLVILRPWRVCQEVQSPVEGGDSSNFIDSIQYDRLFTFVDMVDPHGLYEFADPCWGDSPFDVPQLRTVNGHTRLSITKTETPPPRNTVADAQLDELLDLLSGLDVYPTSFTLI